jgi:hypothetical protein
VTVRLTPDTTGERMIRLTPDPTGVRMIRLTPDAAVGGQRLW